MSRESLRADGVPLGFELMMSQTYLNYVTVGSHGGITLRSGGWVHATTIGNSYIAIPTIWIHLDHLIWIMTVIFCDSCNSRV